MEVSAKGKLKLGSLRSPSIILDLKAILPIVAELEGGS